MQMALFVDDWQGDDAGTPDAPVCFVGRLVDSVAYKNILHAIKSAGAKNWHASQPPNLYINPRKSNSSLFLSSHFSHVMSKLDESTMLYTNLDTYGTFDSPKMIQGYRSLVSSASAHRSTGALGGLEAEYDLLTLDEMFTENPYSRGLVNFISYATATIERDYRGSSGQTDISIYCAYMHFLKDSYWERTQRGVVGTRLSHVPGITSSVHFISTKTPDASDLRHFLGLVDSDTWAFQRLQTCKLQDGREIRDAYVEFQKSHNPNDQPADEEVIYALNQEKNRLVRTYWDFYLKWVQAGRVKLVGGRFGLGAPSK